MILELLKHWGQPLGIGFLANYVLIGSGVKYQSIRTDLKDVRQGPEQDFHTFFPGQSRGNAYDRPVAEIMFLPKSDVLRISGGLKFNGWGDYYQLLVDVL